MKSLELEVLKNWLTMRFNAHGKKEHDKIIETHLTLSKLEEIKMMDEKQLQKEIEFSAEINTEAIVKNEYQK